MHLLSVLRSYGRISAPSASVSSTSFFAFLLCSLIGLKLHQLVYYVTPIVLLVVIYKLTKCVFLTIARCWQECVSVNYSFQRATNFLRVRWVETIHDCVESTFLFDRRPVLIPSQVNALRRSLMKVDQRCNRYLQRSIDYFVSAWLIVILSLALLFASVLLLQQVRSDQMEYLFNCRTRTSIRSITKVFISWN